MIKIRFLYALDLLKVARLGTSYTCDKPSVTEGGITLHRDNLLQCGAVAFVVDAGGDAASRQK